MEQFAVTFSLGNSASHPRYGVPLRCSVPLPQGAVRDPAGELMLVDEAGEDCAAQWRVLSRWKDGSARFALMDYAEAELPPKTTRSYTLVRRPAGAASAASDLPRPSASQAASGSAARAGRCARRTPRAGSTVPPRAGSA